MSSTSVHLPADLLRRLDRVAKRRRVSRNKLITEAVRSIVDAGKHEWPSSIFAPNQLSTRDVELLHSTFDDWLAATSTRRSKKAPPF